VISVCASQYIEETTPS